MEKIYKLIIVFFIALFAPLSVFAASLSFSPQSGTHNTGETFTVNVYVNSSDTAMNAASGTVSFPWDKLQVVSISKSGSIFSLWAEEPSFSNSSGTVKFEGIVLNPGYKGSQGKILSITFRARNIGQANLSFSDGSVLANDGSGTNILNGLSVAVVNITEKEDVQTSEEAEEIVQNPSVPVSSSIIKSSTHPDQNAWYKSNSPEFSWDLPEGALEVRTVISSNPNSTPSVVNIPAVSSRKFADITDGTKYFHLQIRTSEGWSKVYRYKINIDTKPPKSFTVSFPHGKNTKEPQPVILFNTSDDGSGISHYEVKIGNGGPSRFAPIAFSNPYPLPPQEPGSHVVVVTAYDQVGNASTASSDFTIEGIETPKITFYPEELDSGDLVKIRGTTYPNADVKVFIYEEEKLIHDEPTRSNSLGDFSTVVTKRLSPGVYTFNVQVTDGRGAKSVHTDPLTVVINPTFWSDMSEFVTNYLSILIIILLAIGLLAALSIYMWHRFRRLHHHLKHGGTQAERILSKSFYLLHRDLQKHVEKLKTAGDKRKLTKEEIAFLEEFGKNLDEAGEIISKEIQDINPKK